MKHSFLIGLLAVVAVSCKPRAFNNQSAESSSLWGNSNEEILPLLPAGEAYIGTLRDSTSLQPSCAVMSNGSKWEFYYNLDRAEIDGKKYPQHPEGRDAEDKAYEAAILKNKGLTQGIDDVLLNLRTARTDFVKLALKKKLGTKLPDNHRYTIIKDDQSMGVNDYRFQATNPEQNVLNLCYFEVSAPSSY